MFGAEMLSPTLIIWREPGRRMRHCWSREHRCMQLPDEVRVFHARKHIIGTRVVCCSMLVHVYVLMSRDPGFGPCFGGKS